MIEDAGPDDTNPWRLWRLGPTVASIAVSLWALLVYMAAFPGEPGLGFACWVGGSIVTSVVHESGHALAALACQWRVIVFAVGPAGVQLPNRDVAIIARHFRRYRGGWVIAVPRTAQA
ncbi:MAG: hypothetical protein JWO81_2198, partial [Alphaproteobacteria bacterium]|nr:hypothetical protein [Alphaproteobacteria bacterium]